MRRQGNGRDLRAVAPLSQEGQHECFKEDRSTKPGPMLVVVVLVMVVVMVVVVVSFFVA